MVASGGVRDQSIDRSIKEIYETTIYLSGIVLIYSSVSNDTALPKHLPDPSVFIDLEKMVGSTNGRLLTHHGQPSINIVRACDNHDDIVLQHNNEMYMACTTCINPTGLKIILRDESMWNISLLHFINVISYNNN